MIASFRSGSRLTAAEVECLCTKTTGLQFCSQSPFFVYVSRLCTYPAVVSSPSIDSAVPKLFTLNHVRHVGDSVSSAMTQLRMKHPALSMRQERSHRTATSFSTMISSTSLLDGNIKLIDRRFLESRGHTSGEFILFPNVPKELQTKIVALVSAPAKDIQLVEMVDSSGLRLLWAAFALVSLVSA